MLYDWAEKLGLWRTALSSVQLTPDDVHQALECLYENVALARTALAERFPEVASASDVRTRALTLRGILLGAIELLQPARQEHFGSHGARSYDVLNLRYIEGMSVTQVAAELNVVERQVYRDLRHSYEELATVLRPRGTTAAEPVPGEGPGGPPEAAMPLQEELARLVPRLRRLDPAQTVTSALRALKPLADRLGAALDFAPAPALPAVSADEGILKQVLIQTLSLAIQSASSVKLTLQPGPDAGRLVLTASFRPDRRPVRTDLLVRLQRLAEQQHLRLNAQETMGGQVAISISMKIAEPRTVLVIEDNEGAIELYRRYLSQSEEWQVAGASDPRLSHDLATRLRPAVILLDIMMPQVDGWSVLQLLQSQPQTAGIPIIICSVFEDPELAAALGASAQLKKPVSQAQLLAALREHASVDYVDAAAGESATDPS